MAQTVFCRAVDANIANAITYANMMRAAIKMRYFDKVESLYNRYLEAAPSLRDESHSKHDVHVYNAMLDSLGAQNRGPKALFFFESIPLEARNIYSYVAVLGALKKKLLSYFYSQKVAPIFNEALSLLKDIDAEKPVDIISRPLGAEKTSSFSEAETIRTKLYNNRIRVEVLGWNFEIANNLFAELQRDKKANYTTYVNKLHYIKMKFYKERDGQAAASEIEMLLTEIPAEHKKEAVIQALLIVLNRIAEKSEDSAVKIKCFELAKKEFFGWQGPFKWKGSNELPTASFNALFQTCYIKRFWQCLKTIHIAKGRGSENESRYNRNFSNDLNVISIEELVNVVCDFCETDKVINVHGAAKLISKLKIMKDFAFAEVFLRE
ncbi:hypothetical protein [Coxiella burnetii]|uniref:hypothetical protein n=1 Tax=Coxiella burnetii TaxID=777 RepID=UPI0002E199E4|nr:hypothetical protein [Coxiella burnetii]